jgi:hypothetical protein
LALAASEETRTAGTVRASGAKRSPARRRGALCVVGVAVAAAVTLLPTRGVAQAPTAVLPATDSGTDLLPPSLLPPSPLQRSLLQPSLQTNPNNPPRFRRPGDPAAARDNQPLATKTFTSPSRIGATPVYGSPTGFGAGNTGFDSTNTPKRRRRPPPVKTGAEIAPQPETTFVPVQTFTSPRPPKPPAPKKLLPAVIYPARAATRPGAAMPVAPKERPLSNPPPEVYPLAAATRAGGALPVPLPLEPELAAEALPPPTAAGLRTTLPVATPSPTAPPLNTLPLGMQPQQSLPLAAGDPYAPLGIRAGSFLVSPSLDVAGAYSTNPEHVSGASSSLYGVALADLKAQSDWERHSLSADITGSYTQYGEQLVPSLSVPYFNSVVDGRVDVTRDTQIFVENRYLVTTDNPGSPNLQFGLAKLPIDTDLGGTLGVAHEFNRLSVAVLATFDRAVYDNSVLTDGESDSNADRNFNQTAGFLRVGYDLDPGLKPFVMLEADQRIRDEPFDRNNLQRSSVGTSALIGGDVDLFGSLTGEMAGGWVVRDYKDPTLPDVSGAIAAGSLLWQATPLTSAKVALSSEVYETIVTGASGQFTHDVSLEIDHAFLRSLIGTVTAGYGTDNYVGSTLQDQRFFISGGLTYKLSREIAIRGQVRQDWQLATESGFNYAATSFLLGLHLQR